MSANRRSRIEGCLLGAATGDALGAAFEFLDAAEIEAVLGEPFAWTYQTAVPGSLLYPREPARPTDDTAMALTVANVIADGGDLSARAFADAFIRDLDRSNGRYDPMFWQGGPGTATAKALSRLAAGADPETCGVATDGGNGAAMRAHPVGTLRDRDDVLRIAAIQARVTHGHPGAIAAAQVVAVLVHDALAGDEATLEPPVGIDDLTMLTAWRRAHRELARSAPRLPAHLLSAEMSGWATVAAAHAISYVYQDEPRRAIAAAAASGGDTDTIACIVGALVGARNGLEGLDPAWISGLEQGTEVDTMSTHVAGAAFSIARRLSSR